MRMILYRWHYLSYYYSLSVQTSPRAASLWEQGPRKYEPRSLSFLSHLPRGSGVTPSCTPVQIPQEHCDYRYLCPLSYPLRVMWQYILCISMLGTHKDSSTNSLNGGGQPRSRISSHLMSKYERERCKTGKRDTNVTPLQPPNKCFGGFCHSYSTALWTGSSFLKEDVYMLV